MASPMSMVPGGRRRRRTKPPQHLISSAASQHLQSIGGLPSQTSPAPGSSQEQFALQGSLGFRGGQSPGAGPQSAARQLSPLQQLQEQAQSQWQGMSPEQQQAAGGYSTPTAAQYGVQDGAPTGPATVAASQWNSYQPGQGTPGAGGAGGAAGGLGGGLGGTQFDTNLQQWQQGLGQQPDLSGMQGELADLFFQQTMAPLSADFGRRGIASSSMFGAASARASAESQMAAWQQMESQQRLNLQRQQLGLQGLSLQQQREMDLERAALQRAQVQQQWRMHRAELDSQSQWQEIARGLNELDRTPGDEDAFTRARGDGGGKQGGQQRDTRSPGQRLEDTMRGRAGAGSNYGYQHGLAPYYTQDQWENQQFEEGNYWSRVASGELKPPQATGPLGTFGG